VLSICHPLSVDSDLTSSVQTMDLAIRPSNSRNDIFRHGPSQSHKPTEYWEALSWQESWPSLAEPRWAIADSGMNARSSMLRTRVHKSRRDLKQLQLVSSALMV
jgi:hypothetical protein